MKHVVVLLMMLFSVSAFACPDVSGRFGGICTSIDSCDGERPVYYGFEIVQNSCESVKITYLSPGPNKLFTANYVVGARNLVGRSNIRTYVTYSDHDMLLEQTINGEPVNVQTLQKVRDNDKTVLEITSATYGKKCQTITRCTAPEL